MSEGSLIEKEEMFKCHVLLINRNIGRYFKNGKFGVKTGSVGFWRWTRFKFALGDKCKPIMLDRSTRLKKNRSIPLFIVNDLTKIAIGVLLREESDPDLDTKLNLLVKKSFWQAFGETLKLSLGMTLIYFLAGFTLFRFVEYIISIFTGRGI